MPDATMVDVMKFFGMKPAGFKAEWAKLNDAERNQLKQGIGDGTLTY